MKNLLRISIACIITIVCASTLYSQTIIVLQPGPAEGKDAKVWSLSPNTNYADHPILKANAWTWSSTFGKERSYFEFDLSEIPEQANIISANLSLYYHYLSGNPEQTHSGNNECLIQRVTSSWDESSIIWNNQPSITSLHNVTMAASSNPQQSYSDIDVTALVIDMLADPENSFGFEFQIKTEEIYRRMAFATSDHPDADKHPKLVITYECDLPVADFAYSSNNNIVQFIDNSQYASSWFWDFGDGYSSSLQNPIHEYAGNDFYLVCLTAGNECGSDTKCDTVRVYLTNTLLNLNNTHFSISPNPITDKALIKFRDFVDNEVLITLYNINGGVVLEHSENRQEITIDCSKINPGLYLLEIKSGTFNSTSKVLIQ